VDDTKRVRSISRGTIDPFAVVEEVLDDSAGGTVVFIGTIRNRSEGKKVKDVEYQVYREMAEMRMKEIEAEVRKRWPVKKIRMVHREGRLPVGEVSVVVAVSSEHRAEAFEACRYAIDRIKGALPLWKREGSTGGKKKWVDGTPIET
jgi:molybdopterin synthase catalytic subunit